MRPFGCLLVALLPAAAAWWMTPPAISAQSADAPRWIWFDEGDPVREAPAETRYFRKTFEINRPVPHPVDEAEIDITADNEYTLWVNGKKVGGGDNWNVVQRFDVKKHLVHGKNVIAVEAKNTGGPAGLLVRLGYVPNGQSKLALFSDATWKASKEAARDWQTVDFDDARWTQAKELGKYPEAGPWKDLRWEAGGGERFLVPEGFAVELVVPANPKARDLDARLPFSLINMCFDSRGRLLASQERGPIVLCPIPAAGAAADEKEVRVYCEQVKNCQGMCWIKDALWLVGDGPKGTGLYRCRDTNGDDRIDKNDEVTLMHAFQGGMGEHGPHAIIHGPDDQVYVVIGNHAWARIGAEAARNRANPEKIAAHSPLLRWPSGGMGPDQGKPGTTEDVLLPRLNDSRGHAANILAPGGTIWRMDHDGKNLALVAAGFRNHYDAAFSPDGELFTFDSDMEWDEGLPWYRPVAVYHCPPGADFLWRTGAANTPWYYLDSLPPIATTGRGSPVGVEWYDHVAFPARYRTLFLADWALGVIYAVHLERSGGSYRARTERFCHGAPMNVTDLAVGPDGALYFTLGGRGTAGGIYRIVYPAGRKAVEQFAQPTPGLVGMTCTPQPWSAFGRAALKTLWQESPPKVIAEKLPAAVADPAGDVRERIRLLDVWAEFGNGPDAELLVRLAVDKHPPIRAHAVSLLGRYCYDRGKETLLKALKDDDAVVRRRACEALIRAGVEPNPEDLFPLLNEKDRFVQTAARLVLQRIDPQKVLDQLAARDDWRLNLQVIVALCKSGAARNHLAFLLERLELLARQLARQDNPAAGDVLDYYRTLQLALIHGRPTRDELRRITADFTLFGKPARETLHEYAIVLAYFTSIEAKMDRARPSLAELMTIMTDKNTDRETQIHLFYCLRLLHNGWTDEQKTQVLDWFESTKTWSGGHSYTPFLENIFKSWLPALTAKECRRVIGQAEKLPYSAWIVLQAATPGQLPDLADLGKLHARLGKLSDQPKVRELREAILSAVARDPSKEADELLRGIMDNEASSAASSARALARRPPNADNFPYLVRGLASAPPQTAVEIIDALRRIDARPKMPAEPKAEDARPFRLVLEASGRLAQADDKWKCVELLRHWTGKKFTVQDRDWRGELEGWSRWFAQTFPQEPPLAGAAAIAGDTKWDFDQLLAYLERDQRGKKGDAANGRKIFEKANCAKCHKFGTLGEGLGPDLTTLKGRFRRADTLEALLYPSRVISDQYRGSKILTEDGRRFDGLAAVQGDTVTVILPDASKVVLKASEIKHMVASTVSPMPEKLLDDLTREEIADLFAFLDAEPPK